MPATVKVRPLGIGEDVAAKGAKRDRVQACGTEVLQLQVDEGQDAIAFVKGCLVVGSLDGSGLREAFVGFGDGGFACFEISEEGL